MSFRTPLHCLRSFLSEFRPHLQRQRSLATLHRAPTKKLNLPPNLPVQFYAQLPKQLRPDKGKREIIVHKPPPSERLQCKDPVAVVEKEQFALLDPTGARARLFDPLNRDGAKVGDILLTTYKTGEPVSGIIMSIRQRGPSTSVLIRNHLTRIGMEMQIKVFSPEVQSMEIAQKSQKRRRRARLYYLRKPKHDVGSVQKTVDQYLRQRALLTGGGRASTSRSTKGGKRR